jgi:hypothetical protein
MWDPEERFEGHPLAAAGGCYRAEPGVLLAKDAPGDALHEPTEVYLRADTVLSHVETSGEYKVTFSTAK